MEREPMNNRPIISDAPRVWPARWTWALGLVIALVGTAAAGYYASQDLTLSHYDARAHLVVARRISDSLTPGWRQVGAVWLPLPHLLNAIPVAFDWQYRTGFSGVFMSISVLAVGLTLATRYLYRRTGSLAAALAAPALILLNPNVLYLQSTPMTEPLLFGFALLALVAVDALIEAPSATRRRLAGLALAALVMTRYEGWFIAAALGALVIAAARPAVAARLLLYPGTAIAAFLLLSWASTGRWFVTSGFFVPERETLHRPIKAVAAVLWSAPLLGGYALVGAAVIGLVACLMSGRRSLRALAPLSLLAAAALPTYAFWQGHPYRIRYMVPLVIAAGILASLAIVRLPRRLHVGAAAALVLTACFERPPFDSSAPMVLEAQWETPFRRDREAVSRYVDIAYDGRPILASMGSLAHYMQEASVHGLHIANFVHEGNGDLWTAAVRAPRRHVPWVLIEERAEGGDVLAARARSARDFLVGFTRVAEGGGLALYAREP